MDITFFLKTIEIFGLFAGITYVIGAILEEKWCWYAGITATILYAISVYFYNLYGEFMLQFFYLGVSFYGLSQWKRKTKEIQKETLKPIKEVTIEWSSFKFLFGIIIFGAIFTLILYYVLIYFESSYPFWDAVTSGFGIVTTYMVTKKKIENWIFWIIIDIILAVIMYLKGMPFYSGLYIIYVIFAAYGFHNWKKEMG